MKMLLLFLLLSAQCRAGMLWHQFDPREVSTLSEWILADTQNGFFADGTSPATYTNLAAAGTGGNATGVVPPVFKLNIFNGHSVMRYDGATTTLVNALTTLLRSKPGSSLFVVSKAAATSATESQIFVATAGGSTRLSLAIDINSNGQGVGGRRLDANSFQQIGNATATTTLEVVCSIADYQNTTLNQWENTTNTGTSSSFQTSGNTDTLGGALGIGSSSGATTPFNGDIAEVLIYESALVTADRLRIQNWLDSKYRAYK